MAGFVMCVLLFLVGDYLSNRLAIPVPGSIIGMALALLILVLRPDLEDSLREGVDTLLRYLPLILAPIGVGIVTLVEAPPPGVAKLIGVLVVSLIIGVVGTARIMEVAVKGQGLASPKREGYDRYPGGQ